MADLQAEFALRAQGYALIAGIDEAGRGAWAGPVVAGAVILPLDRFDLIHWLDGVDDSKQLSPAARETILPRIVATAVAVSVGYATNVEIDEVGIVPATQLAMKRAVAALDPQPHALLVDALELPALQLPCHALIKGDQRSLSIAAASIVAKTTRDHFMDDLDVLYPHYGFRIHKGYGTPLHRQALRHFGPSNCHRFSFAPIEALQAMPTQESTDDEVGARP